jgi:hypothetical protein
MLLASLVAVAERELCGARDKIKDASGQLICYILCLTGKDSDLLHL